MNRNQALWALEWSRYRSYLPGWKGGGLARLLLYLLVPVGVAALLSHRVDIGNMALVAVALAYLVSSVTFFSLENMQRADPSFLWWLHLPFARMDLVRVRFKVYCTILLLYLVILYAGVLSGYGLASVSRDSQWFTVEQGWALLGLGAVSVAAIPLQAAAGLFTSVFFTRKWRYFFFFILYVSLWLGGIGGLFGYILSDIIKSNSGILWTSSMFVYCVAGAVLSWPLTYGMLRLSAKAGMPNLADKRNFEGIWNQGEFPPKNDQPKLYQHSSRIPRPKGSFSALYQLEQKRVTNITVTWFAKLSNWMVLVGLAVGGYYSFLNPFIIFIVPLAAAALFIYLLVLFLPITITMDIQKRTSIWWLSLPLPRWKLQAARMTVVFVLAARWAVMIYGAYWGGLLFRVWTDASLSVQQLQGEAQWALYGLIILLVFAAAGAGYFQMSAIVNQIYPPLAALNVIFPLVPVLLQERAVYYFIPRIALIDETTPFWDHLVMTGGVCLIVAVLSFWLGIRYVNRLAQVQPRQNNLLGPK